MGVTCFVTNILRNKNLKIICVLLICVCTYTLRAYFICNDFFKSLIITVCHLYINNTQLDLNLGVHFLSQSNLYGYVSIESVHYLFPNMLM